MKIILSAIEPALADAWERLCGDVEGVEVHRGSILDLRCDAVVSPANSFGFMDGGVDALYLDHFGPDIQMKVRRAILEQHHGELVVGAAEIVATDNPRIPYLVAAPTMRVPMILRESVNAYLAARAALLLVARGRFGHGEHAGRPIAERVESIAFPGLGTGVGRMGVNTCARQVRQAIDDVIHGQFSLPRSWAEASERHQLLYTDRLRRLQH
ncbi:macro domain-containing protein [Tundrisphaera sp. TA3]|uniref:macro domain-containing protein n=1 Tax=Tundrisphaera sp. TA3 TaxID=3435775 RepID=UPI003EBE61E5